MQQPQLIGLVCAAIGACMAGQLFIRGPNGAAWYRFYVMVAGASLLVPGLRLMSHPQTEPSQLAIGAAAAFLAGGTGITIGLLRDRN